MTVMASSFSQRFFFEVSPSHLLALTISLWESMASMPMVPIELPKVAGESLTCAT